MMRKSQIIFCDAMASFSSFMWPIPPVSVMADSPEGDFIASTGNIFGKKRKQRKDDYKPQRKDNLSTESRANNDEKQNPKRLKTAKDEKGPMHSKDEIATPSRVVSQIFRGINVVEYLEARALEVSNTLDALNEAAREEGKRVLQRLPRHMRRRAASYDPRRIPRSQRKKAIREVKDNPTKKEKMPSRKHRRRPKNLLDEYNRRKRNHAWLESHIWHAKRFKMIEKWGYKLAEEPCDKGLRSAYRASANGCHMQDISHHGCIEINGIENDMIAIFEHITSKNVGSSIAARNVLSGERTCTIVLYHYDCYPHEAIGPVDVLWKPLENEGNSHLEMGEGKEGVERPKQRSLWIWCHPACHNEVVETLKEAFARRQNDTEISEEERMGVDDSMSISEHGGLKWGEDHGKPVRMDERRVVGKEKERSEVEDVKMKEEEAVGEGQARLCVSETEKNVEGVDSNDPTRLSDAKKHVQKSMDEDRKPVIESEIFTINANTVIKSMKLDFVKFRLTGPLAHQVLVNALQLHTTAFAKPGKWWTDVYAIDDNLQALKAANDAWHILSNVASPGQCPPRVVFGLTVLDPRLNIPIKKTWPGKESDDKSLASDENNMKKTHLLTNWPKNLCRSPIWDEKIREEVKTTKISEADLNKKRSEKLDIGKHLEVDEETSRIPILLIQRPGVRNENSAANHYGSGWDFIAPSGWGMPFLVSFVYRGAHMGGLREERNINLEGKTPHFPKEFPDTMSGKIYLDEEKMKNEEEFNRRPASKRANHEKFGICHPFGADWQTLVDEWKVCCRHFITGLNTKSSTADTCPDVSKTNYSLSKLQITCLNQDETVVSERGFYVLRDMAILGELENFLFWSSTLKRKKQCDGEKHHEKWRDVAQRLLISHRNAVIAVSFQCVGRGEANDNALISIPSRGDFEDLKADKKCNGPTEPLHKGPKATFPAIANAFETGKSQLNCIGSCTRWTIGQVSSGRYSLRTGKGSGFGFVSTLGLVACIESQLPITEGCIVLLRNISSQQYRFARLNIVL